MSVVLDASTIRIEGAGRIEDAETLAGLLQQAGATPGAAVSVDLRAAGHLHAAVVQVLLAFRPPLLGPAADDFVNAWLLPGLSCDVSRPDLCGQASPPGPSGTPPDPDPAEQL